MVRKKRSDRNHIIYLLTNTWTLDTYIGVTAAVRQAYLHSAKLRFKQHISDATTRVKNSKLHTSIREYGHDVFTVTVVHIIRSKKIAHKVETELIKQFKPTLNTVSKYD